MRLVLALLLVSIASGAEQWTPIEEDLLRLEQRTRDLAGRATVPVFAAHFRSLALLARSQYLYAVAASDERETARAGEFIRRVLADLDGFGADWQSYQKGRFLVLAFAAKGDYSVQFYGMRLPRNWDPARAYPLVVNLHGGTSDPSLGTFGLLQLRLEPPGVVLNEDLSDQFVRIDPWARGSQLASKVGEQDILLAVKDAARQVKIDPERNYLMGFSLGGIETWHQAIFHPDLWAAVSIEAGAAFDSTIDKGFGENARNLPVRIWVGEKDPIFPPQTAKRMVDALHEYGNDVAFVVGKGTGHGPPPQRADILWMLQFRRKRPDHFRFSTDDGAYDSVWGIRMENINRPVARLECSIGEGRVIINGGGYRSLSLTLGEEGLGLIGQVKIIHNGTEVYSGAVTENTVHIEVGPAK
jgi:dienelactone hydrolase